MIRSIAAKIVFALVLIATPLGHYLDNKLFLVPMQKLRLAVGAAPAQHPDLRVILFEDRALKRLERQPTAAEWRQIGGVLRRLGFERILFLGFQDGADGLHGVVDMTDDAANLRAVPVDAIPPAWLTPAAGAGAVFRATQAYIGPDKDASAGIERLGLLNLPDDLFMPAALAAGRDAVIPNLGLLAGGPLTWDGRRFRNAAGVVPVSAGNVLHINYLDYAAVRRQAIGASSFFTPDFQRVASAVGETTEKLLRGGKVALLVPDAWTGSRFIATPSGPALSFLAVASIANSALTGAYIYQPFPAAPVVAGWLALMLALELATRRRRRADVAAAAALVFVALVAAGLFFTLGVILPAMQLAAVSTFAGLTAFGARAVANFRERVALAKDLELGKLAQASMFEHPADDEFGPWRHRLVFQPYGPMSGDWVQIYATPPEAPCRARVLAIGDVVGKGPAAALCTASIAAAWIAVSDRWSREPVDLEAALRVLHDTILRAFNGTQNSTISLALLTDDEIVLTSCGAPYWVHVGPDGRCRHLSVHPRNPLGVASEESAPVGFVRLKPAELGGGVLFACTDGLLDGLDARRKFTAGMRAQKLEGELDGRFRAVEARLRASSVTSFPDDITLLMIGLAANVGKAGRDAA